MRRILVTGATGFVGMHLLPRLKADGHSVTVSLRSSADFAYAHANSFHLSEIGPLTDWEPALANCDTVIHLAGQLQDSDATPDSFTSVNDLGTRRLVEQALSMGIERFIFLSSILSLCDHSIVGQLNDQSIPNPSSAYGRSKLAGEKHVKRFADAGHVGIALRAPLVYSADAKGNWKRLQQLAASALPLPFGRVENKRSVLAIENLIDAIAKVTVIKPDLAHSGTFSLADDGNVSLAQILRWLREGMGRAKNLLPIPPALLWKAFILCGKKKMAESLLGDLEIDTSRFKRLYEWSPPINSREGIMRSGTLFRSSVLLGRPYADQTCDKVLNS